MIQKYNKMIYMGRRLLAYGSMAALLLSFLTPQTVNATSLTPSSFHAWKSYSDFVSGQFAGGATMSSDWEGSVTLRHGTTEGAWTSKPFNPSLPINQLVASWQADTPEESWVEVQLSTKVSDHWSKWYNMGKWTFNNKALERTSVPDQDDADGSIFVDTYFSGNTPASAYKLRVVLHGTPSAEPKVSQVGATASDPKPAVATTSSTNMHRAAELPVPKYSQEIHKGEYPQYDGGGEAWCSPTATAMVLSYWHRGPSSADLATLPPDPVFDANNRKDAVVDWAAQHTYDKDYNGTGNWPFNTAYASAYGLDGSVRQYNSLVDAEGWITRGVPLVASIAWDNTDTNPDNDLSGAAIPSSGGHLLVITGFTARGEVITNDPAGATDQDVRRVYSRAQFERIWQNASAGTVYVIKAHSIKG